MTYFISFHICGFVDFENTAELGSAVLLARIPDSACLEVQIPDPKRGSNIFRQPWSRGRFFLAVFFRETHDGLRERGTTCSLWLLCKFFIQFTSSSLRFDIVSGIVRISTPPRDPILVPLLLSRSS